MRLAVVGWCADSGVGRELVEALRHLPATSAFVLPNTVKKTRKDLVPPHVNAFYANPDRLGHQMEDWLKREKPDTILTWEVPGSWDFPNIWTQRSIRWVHMVHWDWFAPNYMHLWKQAILLSPNKFCQKELRRVYQVESTYLPVPIDTARLEFVRRTVVKLYISVYGYGGFQDRRSIPEIFEAWHRIERPLPLVIKAQAAVSELSRVQPHPQIRVEVGNTPEPAGLYNHGQVAVQPSRYEGVGVSMLEAQARGMPVIAIDAPPMNEVAPDLLVRSSRQEMYTTMGKMSPSHVPDIGSLRVRLEDLSGKDISWLSEKVRHRVVEQFSWDALKGRYLAALGAK